MKKYAFIALAAMVSAPAFSATAFDFQGVTSGYYAQSLSLTEGAVTLTVTPEGNPDGYVLVQDWFIPGIGLGAIGTKTKPVDVQQFSKLRFSFNVAIDSITFNFGDGGGDDDGDAVIVAYDAGDNILGTASKTIPVYEQSSLSLTLDFAGARSFVVSSGAGLWNENSVWWDIASYRVGGAVPEPASWAMMIGGFALAGAAIRRRSAATRLA